MITEPYKPDPTYRLNHSLARYKGGYDTDNFTNDFYDESDPTPGWENRLLITVKDNQKPVVGISTPSNGSTVKGKITIAGAAYDPDGVVASVWIKIDEGIWMETDSTWSWSHIWSWSHTWDTTKESNGEHTISVMAYDGYGYNSTIHTVTVNVNNKKETPNRFIPGFEATGIIAVIGICILLLRRQQKN
jgi:hypothetical protein